MARLNDGYIHEERYTVENDARKLIFFNPFRALRVEFFGNRDNYAIDLVLGGVSSMCLCNPAWREQFLEPGLSMQLQRGNSRNNSYFLQPIYARNMPIGYYALKVCTVDEIYDPDFLRVINRRSQDYTDYGIEDIWEDLGDYHTDLIRQRSYEMRPRFFDWINGGAHKPCINIAPRDTHW